MKKLCLWRASYLSGGSSFIGCEDWPYDRELYFCTLCSGRDETCPNYRPVDLKWKYLRGIYEKPAFPGHK